jgi:hypothetical protein
MNLQEAVQKWNELGINRAEFEFDCGGDSMNETTLNFYDKKDKIKAILINKAKLAIKPKIL